jgi:II/X family phage/plasmid replication protein
VFGHLDIQAAAEVLRASAMKALRAYLPHVSDWQCRRVDITGNYALPDGGAVKQALRQLLNTDGVRRKASSSSSGGDTVYWCPTSDISKGKAYHKGAHLVTQMRRGKLTEADLTPDQLLDADKLLRLEHTRAARWFRRFEQAGGKWWELTAQALQYLYLEFFGPLLGGLEVKNMGREHIVKTIEVAAECSHQQALQAFATYRNIKADGYEETKASMARRTWCRHIKILRAAGFSDGQLCAGNVIPFQAVKVLLAVPVASWAELRAAA